MFVLENHVSFKVSPDMFQLEYSTRTGDSASFGLKIAQPDMLQVFVEIVNTSPYNVFRRYIATI